MEKYRLNIDKVIKIEDLYNAGWLFKDIRQNEIVLETSDVNFSPVRLKATFITLCEGILNSNPKMSYNENHKIDYDKFEILDLETLARQLTELTGIHFSSALVF